MKPVFEYLDYRQFLKDYYEGRKAAHAYFSYKVFGDRAGVDASYLAKVLMGSRHIADDSIRHFAEACGLKGPEAEYFEALVFFGKAKTDKQARHQYEKLMAVKTTTAQRLVEEQFDYYAHWYHSAVRLILEYHDFRGDYAALAKALNPPITEREAEHSIALLTRLGLIAPDAEGRYRMTNQAVTSGAEWQSRMVEVFQEECIRLSREALARHPKPHRDVSTVTLNINAEDVAELRNRIREFRKSLINHVNTRTGADRTYQLNIQFFPLSSIE